jgi:zinc/manganese transport system substrate-binding protein
VPVVKVTETLPSGVTDYVTWMSGQVDALGAALDPA